MKRSILLVLVFFGVTTQLHASPSFSKVILGGQTITYNPAENTLTVQLDSSAEDLRNAIRRVPYPLKSVSFSIPINDCAADGFSCVSSEQVTCTVQTINLSGRGKVLAKYDLTWRSDDRTYLFTVSLTSERDHVYTQSWAISDDDLEIIPLPR